MTTTLTHLGRIRNRMHPATPLIIGDLHTIKDWQGDEDGGPSGLHALSKGEVLFVHLELTAPEVLVGEDGHTVLLVQAGKNKPMLNSMSLEEIQAKAAAPFEGTPTSWTLDVQSGALVVSLSYSPTPEEDSDTSELDEDLFIEGETPMVPKAAPTSPTLLASEMAIVPVAAGRYVVSKGTLPDGFLKCEIRKA